MITLTNVLSFQAQKLGQQIYEIKRKAVVKATFKTTCWVDKITKRPYYRWFKYADGTKIPNDKWLMPALALPIGFKAEDADWIEAEFIKVMSCINPKHPDWKKYTGLKLEATCTLIALHLSRLENWKDHSFSEKNISKMMWCGCDWYAYKPGRIIAWMKALDEKIKKGKYPHIREVEEWLEYHPTFKAVVDGVLVHA